MISWQAQKKQKLIKLMNEFNDKHYGTKYFTDTTFLITEPEYDCIHGYRYFVRYYNTYNLAARFKNMDEAITYLENDLKEQNR